MARWDAPWTSAVRSDDKGDRDDTVLCPEDPGPTQPTERTNATWEWSGSLSGQARVAKPLSYLQSWKLKPDFWQARKTCRLGLGPVGSSVRTYDTDSPTPSTVAGPVDPQRAAGDFGGE